mgnify:CR=1 FL=1
MNLEEPEVRVDVQLRNDAAFAIEPVGFAEMGNAVHHQHFIDGQSHLAGEERALSAGFQIGLGKVIRGHNASVPVTKWFLIL